MELYVKNIAVQYNVFILYVKNTRTDKDLVTVQKW